MITKEIHTPLDEGQLRTLRVRDHVLFSGEMYTMRDQAHQRLFDLYRAGKKLPFDPAGKVIYYCGPTPAALPGQVIGSCGPTTSGRMDDFTGFLMDLGVKAFIGKGERSLAVVTEFFSHKCVYLLAVGGAGAYYARRVVSSQRVCFKDLGAEAVYRLMVKDFDVIVGIDMHERYLYSFPSDT